ncbi:MAG: SprB repeat-containing protein, partial [Opitutaceae bacterium]|nr:SprB repeat-containing protein [Cytophagales bacterium]
MRIVYNKHTVESNCFLIFIFCFLGSIHSFAQSPYCGSATPYFTVNLKDNPDSLWLSSSVRRNDLCCGIDPNEDPPVRCVQFGITLDSGAVGIIFNIVQGAVPPGALDYSIDCGIRGFPGEVLCLDGPWPKFLTFCKPGFNPNIYSIKSVPGPKITPPVIVSDGCTQTLSVTGLQLNTIKWTSVPSDPILESYLNCTSACSTVVATYRPGAPDSVVYQASGIVVGNCSSKPAVLTTKVYFVNNKKVDIIPINPIVCFGANNTPITARPSGGRPPYTYLWSTGEKTQTIKVGEGFYEVTVQDASSCPPTKDTVTVKSFKIPILALAGPDQKICNEGKPIKVKLSGAVQATLTGLWKGSGGIFSPSDTSLIAEYIPGPSEIDLGKSTITLITTNIGNCIPHADSLIVTYPLPIPINVEDQTVCTGGNVLFQSTQFSTGTYSWLRNGTVVSTISNYSSIADSSFKIIVSYKSKDGCFSKDSALATVFFKPEIDISDQLVCEDKTVTISSNIINASLAPIAYSWFRNGLKMPDTTSSITTNIKGKYILAYSKGTCQVKDSAMLNFFPVKVNAGPDGVICRLATTGYKLNGTKQNSALVKWIGGSGSYIPSDTVLNPVYYPSAIESKT